MKRLVASVVLFLLAIALSVFGHFSLMKTCDGIIAELNSFKVMAQEENFVELESKSAKFHSEWNNKYHNILSILVGHVRLDPIQENIPLLEKAAELEDKEEYLYACLKCISMLEDLKMNERIDVGNVLCVGQRYP